MLRGEYSHNIDTKGRLIIPAKFREDLGENFFITKGIEKCLYVYPENEWNIFEKELNELKARLKDFEFYKNIHDFLKQRTRNFDEFIQQVDRWARKIKEPAQQKQLNRRQNGPER